MGVLWVEERALEWKSVSVVGVLCGTGVVQSDCRTELN